MEYKENLENTLFVYALPSPRTNPRVCQSPSAACRGATPAFGSCQRSRTMNTENILVLSPIPKLTRWAYKCNGETGESVPKNRKNLSKQTSGTINYYQKKDEQRKINICGMILRNLQIH